MSEGYTKLFADIVDSSIWDDDSDTRIVWVTLLALCNANGFVRGSVGWLAGKSRVSVDKCKASIEKFASPDAESRTPDNEGRRIEILDDGWLILNYLIFRDRLSDNPKAVKTRERVRKHRERYQALRNIESVTSVTSGVSASASEAVPGDKGSGKGVSASEHPTLKEFSQKLGTPRLLAKWQVWMTHRRAHKKPKSWPVMFNEQIEWLERYEEPVAFEILSASIRNGWQGLFEPKEKYGNKITQPNPRNVGVCRAGPTYGEAARLKLQRQSERMERQVAEAANPEPPQVAGA